MRPAVLALLLAFSAASAAEPLQALAPPALAAFPGASDVPVRNSAPLDVGKFCFVTVQNYQGEVTYDVTEGVVAFLSVKPGTQYPGVKQGTVEPAFYPAPESKCDVLMVLGRVPGQCVITAWGVKTEKDATGRESQRAVKLASFVVAVGGAKPEPFPKPEPEPKPKPVPEPYTGKLRILIVEETGTAAANRGKWFDDAELAKYVTAHCSHKPRIVDQDVKDATGVPPKDIEPWLKLAKGKTLPQWFVCGADGTVLLSGDMPDTPAKMLAALKGVSP